MSTLSDIYAGMDQSYNGPTGVNPAQDARQVVAPEQVAAPLETTPEQQAVDNDKEYNDWKAQNPSGGIYEYLYGKYAQKPEVMDPKIAKARKTMAALTDIGSLFAEGLTAGLGGKVNRRDTNATSTNNEAMEKIKERYDANKRVYQDGLLRYASMDKSAASEIARSDRDYNRTLNLETARNTQREKEATTEWGRRQEASKTEYGQRVDFQKGHNAFEATQTGVRLKHDSTEAEKSRAGQKAINEADNTFRATEGDKSRATDEKVAGMRGSGSSNAYNFVGAGTKPATMDPNKYKVGGTSPSAVVGFDPNKYKVK